MVKEKIKIAYKKQKKYEDIFDEFTDPEPYTTITRFYPGERKYTVAGKPKQNLRTECGQNIVVEKFVKMPCRLNGAPWVKKRGGVPKNQRSTNPCSNKPSLYNGLQCRALLETKGDRMESLCESKKTAQKRQACFTRESLKLQNKVNVWNTKNPEEQVNLPF